MLLLRHYGSGVAGQPGVYTFSYLRKYQTIFHSGCSHVHINNVVGSFRGLLQVSVKFYSPFLFQSDHVSTSLPDFTRSAGRKNKRCMSPRRKTTATLHSLETQNSWKALQICIPHPQRTSMSSLEPGWRSWPSPAPPTPLQEAGLS